METQVNFSLGLTCIIWKQAATTVSNDCVAYGGYMHIVTKFLLYGLVNYALCCIIPFSKILRFLKDTSLKHITSSTRVGPL